MTSKKIILSILIVLFYSASAFASQPKLPLSLSISSTRNLNAADEVHDHYRDGNPGIRLDLDLKLISVGRQHGGLKLTGGIEHYIREGVHWTPIMDGVLTIDQRQTHTLYRLGIKFDYSLSRLVFSIGLGGIRDGFDYEYTRYSIPGTWSDVVYGYYGGFEIDYAFPALIMLVLRGEYDQIQDYCVATEDIIPNYTDGFIPMKGNNISVGIRFFY